MMDYIMQRLIHDGEVKQKGYNYGATMALRSMIQTIEENRSKPATRQIADIETWAAEHLAAFDGGQDDE